MERLSVVAGRSNPALAKAIAAALGVRLTPCTVEDFPDGELQVEVHDEIRGQDVYLIQSTSPPVSNHLLELLLLADACQRGGAGHLTAVMPYFGYARQDRRVRGTEPVGARVIADLLCTRLERIVTIDLHNPAIEGFFSARIEHLTAVPLLAEALSGSLFQNSIIVAPDLGAVKLAQKYADSLNLPVTYVQKVRTSGTEVSVRSIVGDVCGRSPIIIDDMISTGSTMVSAIESLLAQGSLPEITIAASHALLVGNASERLSSIGLVRMIVTDSVSRPDEVSLPMHIVSVAGLLADTIKRLHEVCI